MIPLRLSLRKKNNKKKLTDSDSKALVIQADEENGAALKGNLQ